MEVSLNCNNFSYFALNPCSSKLREEDRCQNWLAVMALWTLTLGVGILVYKIIYHIRKKEIDASLLPARVDQVAQERMGNVQENVNPVEQLKETVRSLHEEGQQVMNHFLTKISECLNAIQEENPTKLTTIEIEALGIAQGIDIRLQEDIRATLEQIKASLKNHPGQDHSLIFKINGEKGDEIELLVQTHVLKKCLLKITTGPLVSKKNKNHPDIQFGKGGF